MGYRWRGFEHPELYKMINAGPGPAASDPQTVYWQGLATELAEVDADLNAQLATMGARWEGAAAESAKTGLTPLAEWASDAKLGSDVMRISSENQGEYISDARARMPTPVEVTTQAPSTWDVLTAGAAALTGNAGPAADVAAQAADHEAQEAAQSEAEQRAVETMQTYESSSTWNRDTLGQFVPPPDVVVSTPPPQGGTPTIAVTATRRVDDVAENGSGGTHLSGYTPPTGAGPTSVNGPSGGNGTTFVPTNQVPPGGGGTTVPPLTPPTQTTPQNVFTPPVNPPLPTPPSTTPPGPGLPPGQTQLPPGTPPWYGGDQQNNTGNRNPLTTGTGPVQGNAQDVARRGLPVRPGLPGAGGFPGGPGGIGGPGGFGGAIDGERSPSQLGRGGFAGAGMPGENGVVRTGPGAAGAAGRGGGVNGPVGPGGRRAEDEEDDERFAPDYLLETDDVFGDDRRVSPTVIGE